MVHGRPVPARMTEVPVGCASGRGMSPPEAASQSRCSVRRRGSRHTRVEFAAQPGDWRFASWRVAAIARSRNAAGVALRRRDAPRPAGSRPRGSRAGPAARDGLQLGQRAQAHALRRGSPRASIASNRRCDARVQHRALARREHELEHAHRQAVARVRALPFARSGGRWRDTPPARAGCVAGRWRGCDARRSGSTCASCGMHRGPADARRPPLRCAARNAGSASGIGARPCSSAWKYRPVPPARIGSLAARDDVVDRDARIARRTRRPNTVSHGSRTSIRWCGTCARSSGDGFAAPMSRPR